MRIIDACVTRRLTSSVVSITPSNKIEGVEKGIVPVWIIFCLKEKSQKINLHRWSFNAFEPIIQPNLCVLLGRRFHARPRFGLSWKAFDINSNVGGACGEIVALKVICGEKPLKYFRFDFVFDNTVATLYFEYKMLNIFDKPLYVFSDSLAACLTPIENRCLVTPLCS